MDDFVIETHNLTKQYGDFTAVRDLNLTVKRGEVFGLLGPNGAGKTTSILMLIGLTEPTDGKVEVLGYDPVRQPLSVKALVGYLPEQLGFYDELTARENLIYIAKLNGLKRYEMNKRIEESFQRVGLADAADIQVSKFSRGMRQRLGLADVLIKKPQLIIMDEPTQGLDPERAHEFLQMILDLKNEGMTILLSSHLLHQVQVVCDRVGLFYKGRMGLEGTVPELARKILGGAYRIEIEVETPKPEIEKALQQVPGVVNVSELDSKSYEIETLSDLRADAAAAVVNSGGRLLRLDVESQSLDDIYSRYFEEVGNDSNS